MGEQNKYELTAESIRFYKNRTLYRIRALKDFADIKAGEVGGFVETEKILIKKVHAGYTIMQKYAGILL